MLLELDGIQKSFGGVHALTRGNLHVDAGEVHALIGENGRSVTATELISALPDSGIFHLRRRSGRFRTQPAAKSNFHLVDKLLTSERQTRVRRSPQLVAAKTG